MLPRPASTIRIILSLAGERHRGGYGHRVAWFFWRVSGDVTLLGFFDACRVVCGVAWFVWRVPGGGPVLLTRAGWRGRALLLVAGPAPCAPDCGCAPLVRTFVLPSSPLARPRKSPRPGPATRPAALNCVRSAAGTVCVLGLFLSCWYGWKSSCAVPASRACRAGRDIRDGSSARLFAFHGWSRADCAG